jgi:uncharacterized protein with WD repeat
MTKLDRAIARSEEAARLVAEAREFVREAREGGDREQIRDALQELRAAEAVAAIEEAAEAEAAAEAAVEAGAKA